MPLSIWKMLKFFGLVVFNAIFFLIKKSEKALLDNPSPLFSEPCSPPHPPLFSHTAFEVPQQNI